ncbi:MAG: hypothetical protein IJI25_08740 [Eubacterium sp.]|nr:hypothetical protein [Eubacterium sp.]
MSSVAYFSNSGALIDVSPRSNPELCEDRQTAYHADYICMAGQTFDLHDPASISSLPVPAFDYEHEVVFDLSYIMKIICGSIEDTTLIPAFTQKTLELMDSSKVFWQCGDFLQVIRNYYRCNLIQEGSLFESCFRKSHHRMFNETVRPYDEGDHLATKYYFENRNRRYAEYEAVKNICPDLVPKTVKGYLQIRTRQTKRFKQIQEICENKGISFNFDDDLHFCSKFNSFVKISKLYEHKGRSPQITKCSCSFFENGICDNPVDEYGLSCIFR